MKTGKRLSDYLERIKASNTRRDYRISQRIGEWCLKNIAHLTGSPNEKYLLYYRLGYAYYQLMDYSRSIDSFYKATLVAVKDHLPPVELFDASLILGHSFIGIRATGQALRQFQKAERYYRTYQYQFGTTKQSEYFSLFLGQAYCFLLQNDLSVVWEILERKLSPILSSVSNKGFLIDYYHLKGEYEVANKQYAPARQSFQQVVALSDELHLERSGLEAQIHLAMIDLVAGQLETAWVLLSRINRTARALKFDDMTCESILLLGKYYLLEDQPTHAARLEKQIKPLLKKVDIVWLYEKIREFDEFYWKLKLPEKNNTPSIPKIITQTINQHYVTSAGKDMVIGNSAAMRETWQLVEKIALTDLPVLIQGETGTGKELIANAIHANSQRVNKTYLPFNCGAFPETLIESTLFGHAKGAFTGATEEKKGYIELASGGTLFIDEIGNMSPSMQQKLLRVMEEKLLWKVGGQKPIPVDTRFIFASNQDIEQMVKNKLFREDLFYRINTIVINLPPLRDRKDDILLLTQRFLAKYRSLKTNNQQLTTNNLNISPSALALLVAYSWPGNVRELENEIKRICVLYPDAKTITETMLSETIRTYRGTTSFSCSGRILKDATRDFQKRFIQNAIQKHPANLTVVARELGLTRWGFYKKMRELKISTDRRESGQK
ncbi:MAG: sigma 54-interacting transcriptional regulator [Planctomycetes bacterium]|nr:sigma 54-interacting transcriptional regulator [Planctomycetota bacterium]